ncbi:MAG: hypothetical protein ABEI52_01415, partial [Halobacteriaceae archaeon]
GVSGRPWHRGFWAAMAQGFLGGHGTGVSRCTLLAAGERDVENLMQRGAEHGYTDNTVARAMTLQRG